MSGITEAKLILEDGSSFYGYSFGAGCSATGEVVFNTGMVGYPESFTDPSYRGQILALTYPLIGNYGVPSEEKEYGLLRNFESDRIHISGLVISDYSSGYSHWNAEKSLGEWLKEQGIPALYGIDTRKLTKKLRETGVMPGKIIADIKKEDRYGDKYDKHKKPSNIFNNQNNPVNPVDEVAKKEVITYEKGNKKILLLDCGVKNSIIRSFLKQDVTVIRVPWNYDFLNSGLEYDGIAISNGPGDPKMCAETIANVEMAMKTGIPVFGICLGNQILALAAGADTYKLKYGHRSQNQPCILQDTKKCFITSQNHGYAVDTKTLKPEWEQWFYNANDSSNEGIRHKTKPFFSIQFHPEAKPGPVDTGFLFDDFLKELK